MLEEVSFVMYEQFKCLLHNLFGNESSTPMHQPLDSDSWPNYQNNKKKLISLDIQTLERT
jgi:hypothetical protein